MTHRRRRVSTPHVHHIAHTPHHNENWIDEFDFPTDLFGDPWDQRDIVELIKPHVGDPNTDNELLLSSVVFRMAFAPPQDTKRHQIAAFIIRSNIHLYSEIISMLDALSSPPSTGEAHRLCRLIAEWLCLPLLIPDTIIDIYNRWTQTGGDVDKLIYSVLNLAGAVLSPMNIKQDQAIQNIIGVAKRIIATSKSDPSVVLFSLRNIARYVHMEAMMWHETNTHLPLISTLSQMYEFIRSNGVDAVHPLRYQRE